MEFKKATKRESKLRLSIAGPAGSGKTYTALKVATEMGGKIALIDTERGSAAKYSDIFDFDVLELTGDYHPERYIEAIQAAERAGYDILIIDSTTHEWNGRGGILDLHEAANARKKNSFAAWADVTPLHNAFIDAILQSKCHVIASVRSKVDYVQEKDERGKTEVKKVGMATIQREGMDYEYDVMVEMNLDHKGIVMKTRCAALDGKVFTKPGRELAEILNAWLSDGAPAPQPAEPSAEDISVEAALKSIWIEQGKDESEWEAYRKSKIAPLALEAKRALLAKWQAATISTEQRERDQAIDAIDTLMKGLNTLGVSDDQVNERIGAISKGADLTELSQGDLTTIREGLELWRDMVRKSIEKGKKAA